MKTNLESILNQIIKHFRESVRELKEDKLLFALYVTVGILVFYYKIVTVGEQIYLVFAIFLLWIILLSLNNLILMIFTFLIFFTISRYILSLSISARIFLLLGIMALSFDYLLIKNTKKKAKAGEKVIYFIKKSFFLSLLFVITYSFLVSLALYYFIKTLLFEQLPDINQVITELATIILLNETSFNETYIRLKQLKLEAAGHILQIFYINMLLSPIIAVLLSDRFRKQ